MGIVRHNGCHASSTDAERKIFPSSFQPFKMASSNCTCNYRFQLSALMVSLPCVGAGVGMATKRSRAEHRDPYIPCQPSLGRSVRHQDDRKPEPAGDRSPIIGMNHRLPSRLSLRPESMRGGKFFLMVFVCFAWRPCLPLSISQLPALGNRVLHSAAEHTLCALYRS